MIQARLLRQFIAVAEELHFGRAAARLHMAQPPLSQAIKHLEEIVGVSLFKRSRHYVALTPAGSVFLDEARELLLAGQRAIDAARHAEDGPSGRVTIGFVGSASFEILPRILRELRRRFPAIHIELRELASTEQIASLAAERIDVGVVRLPINNAADFALREICSERFVVALPIDHPRAKARTIRLKDLSDEPFMTFPPDRIPALHTKVMLACETAGFSPRIAMEAWQTASMVSLVAAGMGVALLPEQVRSCPHPKVVFKTISDQSEHLELKIAAVWHPDRVSAGVRAVLSVLDEI
ncbi:LysR substrate-binding domain-containing protein [Paraburkholderia pallida]|uniref:LysR family transcriptional regulator n=1 Tax=Paraburkholderia pallida TaxID=2547399 RepID=A0A4P7DBK4_9BURK|nr:LysR substrate-binding domain-containing protein [Paraburkholderia pallida]QBR04324.1 LysR family transcriptional regulator [Paraburkholderia pallida]